MDASALVVPLWPAISISTAILCTLIGVVVWVLSVFERKVDAAARESAFETHISKVEAAMDHRVSRLELTMGERVSKLETIIDLVARDVSYIRGWLEKESKPPKG